MKILKFIFSKITGSSGASPDILILIPLLLGRRMEKESYSRQTGLEPAHRKSILWMPVKGTRAGSSESHSVLRTTTTLPGHQMGIRSLIQRELGYSPAQAGMAFATAMLVGSIGQPIVGRLSDRRGRFGIFAVSSMVAAGLAGAVILFDTPALMISLLTMAMAVLVAIRSGVLAMAVDHAGKHEATALGFVFVVLDGVGALGAVLAGLVGDFSLVASFGLAGGLSLLAVGFIAAARR